MAWHEKGPSGNYFICLRVGEQRFRRSLKTANEKDAIGLVARVEENLGYVERGRMVIPADADVVSFLLSDGKLTGQVVIPEQTTLRELFALYFASITEGTLERSTIEGMKLHQRHLERHLGQNFPIRTLTIDTLREYVRERAKDKGQNGTVTGTTIKKAVVTFRTAWNFGLQKKLVEGPFPAKGIKYPKSKEKPPYMPFRDIQKRTKGMDDKEAAELWECVFLPTADLDALLAYVKASAKLPFIFPSFVFAVHLGARRSEIARAKISDIDLASGLVTLHERKRAHDKKTTRRVPMSKLLKQVLTKWLAEHPGGNDLFCHSAEVQRSKKRSATTGHKGKERATTVAGRMEKVRVRTTRALAPLTRDELHDHFKRTLAGSEWENLRGWHVLRHSFISALAAAGTPQNIIDEFSGHMTDEQRRRYRHLLPNSTKQAIAAVFG